MMRTPDDAMEVYVVGKQWMWQLQHPEGGQREINELHIPVGKPVKLIMTSEDVIHDFFVPAFRVKQDVVPGRYTYLWFQATKAGDYHLFCAEYCGTQHSRMGGWVHVMEPEDYQKWLSGKADLSMALRGRQLFLKYPVHRLPQRRQQGPRPAAGRTLRQAGVAGGRPDRRRPTRTTSVESIREPEGRHRVRLQADHAGVRPRPDGRPAVAAARRLHQGPRPGPDANAQRVHAGAGDRAGGRSQRSRGSPKRRRRCRTPSPPQGKGAGGEGDVSEPRPLSPNPSPPRGEGRRSRPAPLGRNAHDHAESTPRRIDYLNVSFGVRSWLLTTDHKRIAILYLVVITLMFFIGGAFASVIRLELATPKGDLVEADTYNKLFTMHGVVMIFFFLIPSIPAVFGNFLVPMMIGAKDLAFPKLNLLELVRLPGRRRLHHLGAWSAGGVDTGWTFYTPYSTHVSHTYVLATGVGVFIAGFSSILTGLNFVVTIHRMRAPGLTWFRLPLFVWSMYATSIIMLLGTPVVAITLLLVAVERVTGIGIFDPTLGGDPILFQHLFWFYSHPAVYIMILPSMGVVSELISTFSRKTRLRLQRSSPSPASPSRCFGFLVWGHHMFVSGQSIYAGMIFSILELPGGRAVGDQGVQLDGHALQGLDFLPDADAVRLRLHRPVHHRRPDGPGAGDAAARRPRPRHLLRRGPLPLHHGGRRHHGLHGGAALLVAEDDRPHVPRRLGQAGGAHHFRRLQPDVFPAVPARLPGHEPPLLGIRPGVSGSKCDVVGRGDHPRRRLPAAAHLLPLVAALRREGPSESLGATGLEWQTPSPPPPDNFPETPTVTQPPYVYKPQEAQLVN